MAKSKKGPQKGEPQMKSHEKWVPIEKKSLSTLTV